jgi:MoaA/NifB/PqqE/SkfB family radical SAM enzyme/SAM-dependent methyltransferase
MAFDPRIWQRLEHDGIPIWIHPDKPDWFVPNRAGDVLLQRLQNDGNLELDTAGSRFLLRLPDGEPRRYEGRHTLLHTAHLRELWFHITNRCNLTCEHCLVSSSPAEEDHLDAAAILDLAAQSRRLGCSVFALTGGEPFIHREFETIIDGLLGGDGAHAVVLTNGMFLRRSEQAFARWPMERLHLQVSVDGLQDHHDRTRGGGTFAKLERELAWLGSREIPFTVSMCVMRENLVEMPDVVDFAASVGASNVHFLWYFVRGRGEREKFVAPEDVFDRLREAHRRAEAHGLKIDNIETHRTQVFSPAGTLHDGGNSGWESVAVGFDGRLYPSPALVGMDRVGTPINGDLGRAWKQSPVLDELRRATAARVPSPLRFIVGGGDHDHSLVYGGRFQGGDPYLPLYEKIVLWQIASEAALQSDEGPPRLRLKMGEVLERCGERGEVALNHSNCVLALATRDHVGVIKEFYSRAAEAPQEQILNPACYPDELVEHIPEECRVRSYGCGSPVLDAGVRSGESLVDLGSGAGVECLIASRMVGPEGKVTGIDMLDPMLALARKGAAAVGERLGYGNVEFKQAYLEALPLEDDSVDVVISNCVINLSQHKRRTFAEVFRVLKPGGRLVVSDVVCETEPDSAIRNDETLHGECIAGALLQRDLFGLLEESGFTARRVIKRFPYRVVRDHPFFSMTFEARKPVPRRRRRVMYRGPFPGVITPDGTLLTPGMTHDLDLDLTLGDALDFFEFDDAGAVTNLEIGASTCCVAPAGDDATASSGCCSVPPEQREAPGGGSCCGSGADEDVSAADAQRPCGAHGADKAHKSGSSCCGTGPDAGSGNTLLSIGPPPAGPSEKRSRDCMLCGAPLVYFTEGQPTRCEYCGNTFTTTALCEKGHFVCDRCHAEDGIALIEEICASTEQTDMLALLQEIRRHRAIPLHGPEHHALVPGVILATYRNLGGRLTSEALRTGIRRGAQVAGGSCGFSGNCGAAMGVGIAISVILEGNPLTPEPRAIAMRATSIVLEEIAKTEAPRCCQRECYVALKKLAALSSELLPLTLRAEAPMRCRQMSLNTECIGPACPLIQDLVAAKSQS